MNQTFVYTAVSHELILCRVVLAIQHQHIHRSNALGLYAFYYILPGMIPLHYSPYLYIWLHRHNSITWVLAFVEDGKA